MNDQLKSQHLYFIGFTCRGRSRPSITDTKKYRIYCTCLQWSFVLLI